MKPHVICLMIVSIDGRLHPSRYTESPDGTRQDWTEAYERQHDALGGDAWLVGRVTMAEMAKASAHPPASPGTVARPLHVAARADSYAVAVDRTGKLHFDGGTLSGDHVIVLLGAGVPDSHLAELAGDHVSYLVSPTAEIDFVSALETLSEAFGIRTMLLEGGGGINGALLAAGVVDELQVLVAPALDGGDHVDGIVRSGPDGLAGKVQLSLLSAETRTHGTVLLRYAVKPGGAQPTPGPKL